MFKCQYHAAFRPASGDLLGVHVIEDEGVHAASDEVNLFLADKLHKGLPVEPGRKTKKSGGGTAIRRPS